MRSSKEHLLLEMPAHKLHADGQILVVEADRKSQAGHASQVGGQGENIFQVHGERIVTVLADLESGGGRYRSGNQVNILECALEIALDQSAHLLRLL